MTSDRERVEYIVDQLSGAGEVRVRAMFGEWTVYCDDKVIGLICRNTLFIKPTPGIADVIRGDRMEPAYPGAKPSHVIADDDLDDGEYLSTLARLTADALPRPKPRAKRP